MSTQKRPAGALATETSATEHRRGPHRQRPGGQHRRPGARLVPARARRRDGRAARRRRLHRAHASCSRFLSPFFLTERNFANLLTQAATLVMLGMALVFVILLGEIDLSAGVTARRRRWRLHRARQRARRVNWLLALAVAFAGRHPHRHVHRVLRREGRHPVVRRDTGPVPRASGPRAHDHRRRRPVPRQIPEIQAIQNSNMPVWAGWVMLGGHPRRVRGDLVLGSRAAHARGRAEPHDRARLDQARRHRRHRRRGRSRSSASNRGQSVGVVEGVPIVVPIVLVILWIGTFVLDRTRYGRYIYAIGGNAEAARRSGVKVMLIRWTAFICCSTLAVVSRAVLDQQGRLGRRRRRARHRALAVSRRPSSVA